MAKKFAKWIGGAVGWALGGPIGAIVGYSLGYLYDNASQPSEFQNLDEQNGHKNNTREGDFNVALIVLSAAVMKADHRVLKSELAYVKRFLSANFSDEKALELLRLTKEILNKEIDVQKVCVQVRQHMSHAQRLQLMHFLIGIAKADGTIDAREVQILKEISKFLYVSMQDFSSMDAMHTANPSKKTYLKVLELEENASQEEIKSAYRRLVKKYHPDKLGDVGEDVKQAALDKFRKVQEAYEFLKTN